MDDRLRVGVLISGRGSNLQALLDACADPDFPAQIVCVVSNHADAYGLERAVAAGVPTAVVSHRDYPDRKTFDAAINESLGEFDVEFLCLAGFMRILDGQFVARWRDRLINIHPSLLPSFPGLDTHQRALDMGVKVVGCTVHFVRADVDTGPIIAQAAVPVLQDDDAGSLAARVLEKEHEIYPRALRLCAEGRVTIDGDRAVIDAQERPDALV
ncbi:MAG: phosphoribosylglycinamide formyltransferase [Rhodospirillaceae bacterium]|jgi:phosphoribosylglycinamide formyltransferase 1|nr:phosphoribosylglycinamide formyltransferase [Rhodospirillaceae bacterium]